MDVKYLFSRTVFQSSVEIECPSSSSLCPDPHHQLRECEKDRGTKRSREGTDGKKVKDKKIKEDRETNNNNNNTSKEERDGTRDKGFGGDDLIAYGPVAPANVPAVSTVRDRRRGTNCILIHSLSLSLSHTQTNYL